VHICVSTRIERNRRADIHKHGVKKLKSVHSLGRTGGRKYRQVLASSSLKHQKKALLARGYVKIISLSLKD